MALESENALPPHVRTAFGVAEVDATAGALGRSAGLALR